MILWGALGEKLFLASSSFRWPPPLPDLWLRQWNLCHHGNITSPASFYVSFSLAHSCNGQVLGSTWIIQNKILISRSLI